MRYKVALFLLMIAASVFAQQKKIKGKVVSSEDGEPLIGVSILVKGTTNGTITDFDGNFELDVSEGSVLVVSFVGMTTQYITVDSRNEYQIVLLPESVALKEVVVVAYGTQRKDRFNGSVTSVKSEEITSVPSASVDKMLQGNVPGLLSVSSSGQPGAASEMRIRGIGSILASSEPLYVIDGVPVTQGSLGSGEMSAPVNILSLLNPNDIESVSVLKDAAAASLYGSRAANGVVLITTRKGKKGKTQYTFKTTQGYSTKAMDRYRALTASEYVQLRKVAMENAGFPQWQIDLLAGSDSVSTDWAKEVYRQAWFSTYDLSAAGGDEKTQFFISGSYLNQQGIIIGTGLQKGTARINLTTKATEKLTYGLNTTLSYSLQQIAPGKGQFSNPVLAADLLPPNIPVKNPDGTYNYNFVALSGNNPVGLSHDNINEVNTAQNLSNLFLEYKLTPDLKVKTSWGTNYIDLREKYFQNPYYGVGTATGGLGQRFFSRNMNWLTSNTINYTRKFNEVHGIEWLGGFEAQSFRKDFASIRAVKYPTDRYSEIDAAAEPYGVGSYISRSSLVSFFSNVQYNYNERYYLSASYRNDGCSRFSKDHRWASFYSVGASWRINEEAFLKDIYWINDMKLRTSYGTSGNSEIGDFRSLGTYGFTSYHGNAAIYPLRMANPNLTWEKNKVFNAGIDSRVYNRFTLTAEYFYRITSDLLLDVPLSSTTGFLMVTRNVGSMVNKGWEFTLSSDNLKGEITWTTSFNFTLIKNKILTLYEGQDIIDETYGVQIRRVGEDFNSYYLRRWAGVNPADGSAMWYDKNGNVVYDYTKADKQVVGSATPKCYGGLTNTFGWNNLELSFLFVFMYGNKIYDFWSGYTESDGRYLAYNQSAEQLNYWKKPGDVVPVPKPVYGNPSNSSVGSTRYLHDGSYVRLRNLSLGYRLPKSLMDKLQMASAKIYFSGQNLLTFTRYRGHDVERGSNGINDMSYPNVRTLTVGLETSF